ncbi:MAG TPA: hypothetical protein VFY06_00310, partial [Verrucomicrobiae bacterium]|nr:hypothetical protein [Verrucomicrobiae bacterium]
RWLKLTGRYHLLNLAKVLAECRGETRASLIIDQICRRQFARTYLFCASTEFYLGRIRNLYKESDDRTGEQIECVLFRELAKAPAGEVRFFTTQPRLHAQAASTGAVFPTGRFQWFVKQCLRRLNRLVDDRRLLYSGNR